MAKFGRIIYNFIMDHPDESYAIAFLLIAFSVFFAFLLILYMIFGGKKNDNNKFYH